uniref:F-box domain-containing protein n=1 Tax=Steinernema glaseri TaxID=37863 RepID=A0A1I7Z0J4_9BILA
MKGRNYSSFHVLQTCVGVSARDLWDNVRPVNTDLNEFLHNDHYWTNRLKTISRVHLSKLEKHHPSFDPIRKSLFVEREYRRWSRKGNSDVPNDDFIARPCHDGTVDAVKLFSNFAGDKRFCITGARDHKIALWDLSKMQEMIETGDNSIKPIVAEKREAHDGWIWQFCVESTRGDIVNMFSCGWDKSVRNWRVTPTGITELGITVGEHAHLCMSADRNLLYSGTMKGGVRIIDLRATERRVRDVVLHRGAVLDIIAPSSTDYLYTTSEDGTVAMHDRRNWKRIHASRMPNGDGYFSSISMRDNILMAHSSKGWFTCMDKTNLRRIIMPYTPNIESDKSRQILLKEGALFVKGEREVHVYTTGKQPYLIGKTGRFDSVMARMDYAGGVMALGSGSGEVLFYFADRHSYDEFF